MMDFFTHCFKRRCLKPRQLVWAMVCAVLVGVVAPTMPGAARAAAADATAVDPAANALQLERVDDGLYLSTTLPLVLPELVQDALNKGISMFFVAEAQVVRDRWYWSDREVARAVRYLRLSYQPLTRRWRLNIASEPFSNIGLGVVLAQNFDSYEEALSAIGRISRWKIADRDALDADGLHTVHFRFRLDMSQLPRPFQIGVVGRSGWNVLVTRSQRLAPETAR